MLFTTAAFVLGFLPLALVGFFLAPSSRWAAAWLFGASVFFYGWWMPQFTLLLLASITFNFLVGRHIAQAVSAGELSRARPWLIFGVTANLAALGWFKYANFFAANLAALTELSFNWTNVVLPIGISFFTFTQIAFLVDASRGLASDYRYTHYGLFVTYFPHLVAGPILHHRQMMPQFGETKTYRFNSPNFAAGLAIFALGLVKKVVFADGIAPYADAGFQGADAGSVPSVQEAWLATSAYTLQLYFDFSGYSDMAIGLSWMFNIRLPFNFDSPYRATNISEFWRRWHISLSNFLRDYLYIPLGGNRRGMARRYANLLTTMVLGGLWHGASWSFVVWGLLHGLYLVGHQFFRRLIGDEAMRWHRWWRPAAWALTLLAVMLAWVFFRAETLAGAVRLLGALSGAQANPDSVLMGNAGLNFGTGWAWCAALGAVACLVPFNSNHIGVWLHARTHERVWWCGGVAGFAASAVASLVLINTARDSVSAFIYFNF